MKAGAPDTVSTYFRRMTALAAEIDTAAVQRFADLLYDAWREERFVFVYGNGGSAYNASHHVCDLVKTANVNGTRALRAISLVDNVGIGTAVANDVDYDETFRYPLSAYARPRDIAVAISCSGSSPNVVRASEWARTHGLYLVGLTGFDGGRLKDLADIHIHVPSHDYGVVEDLHLSVGHIVTRMLGAQITADSAAATVT